MPDPSATYALILAGGSGTRFWPLSRQKKPKQLLPLASENPLVADTAARLVGMARLGDVLTVCGKAHASSIRKMLPEESRGGVVVEPVARNTAPAIGLAATIVAAKDPQGVLLVLPSDHAILDLQAFRETVQQAADLDEIGRRDWDFVAIQPVEIDTLAPAVNRLIAAGIPIIDMDTLIAPLDQIDVHTFLAPDNEFMGAAVTKALVDAIGGEGTIIMTQGALGHTGAQGRARGFRSVIAQHTGVDVLATDAADWDPAKVVELWEGYLDTFSDISAAFFHNDDMALAALEVMESRGRTEIVVGGVDAMPPAIQAVLDGRMHATVRNSSCRIHGGATVAGVEAALAKKKTPASPPKQIVIDGPIVTPANAPGLLWMQEHFLI